jgi:hypothetical protein
MAKEKPACLFEFAWCAWRARDLCMFADMLAADFSGESRRGRWGWPVRSAHARSLATARGRARTYGGIIALGLGVPGSE